MQTNILGWEAICYGHGQGDPEITVSFLHEQLSLGIIHGSNAIRNQRANKLVDELKRMAWV